MTDEPTHVDVQTDDQTDDHEIVTPEEIAGVVVEMHDTMDEIKEWSLSVVQFLEEEIERFHAEGDDGAVDATVALMEFTHTLHRRIVEGEEASLMPLGHRDELYEME